MAGRRSGRGGPLAGPAAASRLRQLDLPDSLASRLRDWAEPPALDSVVGHLEDIRHRVSMERSFLDAHRRLWGRAGSYHYDPVRPEPGLLAEARHRAKKLVQLIDELFTWLERDTSDLDLSAYQEFYGLYTVLGPLLDARDQLRQAATAGVVKGTGKGKPGRFRTLPRDRRSLVRDVRDRLLAATSSGPYPKRLRGEARGLAQQLIASLIPTRPASH